MRGDPDPRKPTILIVGNSHAAHLFAGLQEVYGAKANLLTLSSVYCVPLVENVAMDQGVAGTPRCRAINDYVFDAIRTIKPDVLIVGGYFAQYDHEANWRYPGYLDALVAGARRLHADGVRSIIVAGQVPTWAPVLPILVGRDVLERGAAAEFSAVGVRPDSLETDRALAAKDWGEGVRYVSQAAKLCGPEGCRRLIGETLPAGSAGRRLRPLQPRGIGLRRQNDARAGHRRRTEAAGKELTLAPPPEARDPSLIPPAPESGKDCAWTSGSSRVRRIAALTSALPLTSTA